MKFVSYKYQSKVYCGILVDDMCYSFCDFLLEFTTMNEFLQNYSQEVLVRLKSGSNKAGISIDSVEILSPIISPLQDVLCVGVNYLEHAKESATFKGEKFETRDYPVYFSKRVDEMVSPFGEIPLNGDITNMLDYEVELGVILCNDIYKPSRDEVLDSIFGYTIINDISARDLQKRYKQFYFGKSLKGSCVMGPCIVSKDEFNNEIPSLDIQCYVNGELRQNSNTRNMIFKIDSMLYELSHAMKLKSGTILSTGTPSGVGMGFNPPRFLKGGDLVECKIEKIGSLKNFVSSI